MDVLFLPKTRQEMTRAARWLIVLVLGLAVGCAANPLKQALQLEQSGNYAEAIAAYESIAATNPGTPEARQAQLSIAKIYLDRMNDPEKGLAVYAKLIESAPKSDEAQEARYQTGLYYFRTENYDKAAPFFQEIVNTDPTGKKSADAQLMLAKTYERAGKIEEAEKTYGAFSALHSDDAKAALALEARAKLLEQLGKKREAIETRQQIVREYGADERAAEVVSLAKKGLKAEGVAIPKPKTPETMSRGERAQVRRQRIRERDRPQSAREEAQKEAESNIFGINADHLMQQMNITVDEQGTMYDAMFVMATTMQQSGQYKEAGALYQRAIELAEADESRLGTWENLGAAYKGLADVYRKLGLKQLADEYIQKAMRKNPAVIDQIIDSGKFDYGVGDYEKAIETWEAIAGLNPGKDSEIYYNIGVAYKQLEDTPNEVKAFEHAVAANPKNMDAIQSLAEVLYYRAGQRQRAYLFQDAVDEKPSVGTYMELGMLAFKYGYWMNAQRQFNIGARVAKKRGELEAAAAMEAFKAVAKAKRDPSLIEEAAAELAPVVEANPDNWRVRYAAGLMAQIQKDEEKAIAEFQKAIELAPKEPDPVKSLANLYIARDDPESALAVYDAFIERNPRNREILQLRDILKIRTSGPSAVTPTSTAE